MSSRTTKVQRGVEMLLRRADFAPILGVVISFAAISGQFVTRASMKEFLDLKDTETALIEIGSMLLNYASLDTEHLKRSTREKLASEIGIESSQLNKSVILAGPGTNRKDLFDELHDAKEVLQAHPKLVQESRIRSVIETMEMTPPISKSLAKQLSQEVGLSYLPGEVLVVPRASFRMRSTADLKKEIDKGRAEAARNLPEVTAKLLPPKVFFFPRNPAWAVDVLLYLPLLAACYFLFLWKKHFSVLPSYTGKRIGCFVAATVIAHVFLVHSVDLLGLGDWQMVSAPFGMGLTLYGLLMSS